MRRGIGFLVVELSSNVLGTERRQLLFWINDPEKPVGLVPSRGLFLNPENSPVARSKMSPLGTWGGSKNNETSTGN